MVLFESTLALLLGAVILTGVARRVGVPYPSLLAIAGAALAFVPAGPELEMKPDLALALFVAPVLLDAAFDTSPRDLRRNVVPLASLVVVAVGLTTAAVAWIGWWLGGLPVAAAVALGAIVAPPDAAAAAAVLGRLRLPRRILHVLRGESLLNDATALVVYRIAVGVAVGTITLGHAGPILALLAVGSPTPGRSSRSWRWEARSRDLIVLSAFCVVLGTLVIQGFTLRPLLDRLGFEADGAEWDERSRADVYGSCRRRSTRSRRSARPRRRRSARGTSPRAMWRRIRTSRRARRSTIGSACARSRPSG